jgi:2-dehydropantoate 2-reductase
VFATDQIAVRGECRLKDARQKVAVVGMGAIGTVTAEAVDADRYEVISCRRSSSLPMSVLRDGVSHVVSGRVVSDPAALETVDWVILATKAVSDPSAWMDRLVGPQTTVAVLQNGIDLRRRVERWVGPERVVPVTVTMAAERTAANEVTVVHDNELVTEATPLAARFAALFGPQLRVRTSADYRSESWRKLMLNAAVNPMTTITGSTAIDCLNDELLPTTRTILEEVLTVANAKGIDLSWPEVDATIERIRGIGAHLSSMQMDFRLGRPIEHRFITGAVIENAESVGLDVPVIRTMHALLAQLSATPTVTSQPGVRATDSPDLGVLPQTC